tara:strand:+ start:1120 stop:2310 length:1191 start_codon:yes stop_codon:yes gene_type:complete
MKKLKKGLFPFIIAASALSVSVSAAFYSVSGLSKLFAGAALEVMIMAGSLEVAKLVIASLLYQYWNSLNKLLRSYLVVAATVLVLITSMGIYGFLSAAYQETYSKLTIVENEKGFIQKKLEFYQNDVNRYDEEITRISSNISTLSNAKATSIQVRDTSVSGGVRTTISTTELRMAQSRINIEEENRKVAQRKREVVSDSLQKFQLQILALENNSSVAGELGPLKYLSGLTDTPMDSIINILLLVIIFVFDPLALALVVAANFAFDKAFEKNLYGEYSDADRLYDDDSYVEDQVKTDINDIEVDAEVVVTRGPYSSRMDIIGQNGNDGEHYEDETIRYAGTPSEEHYKDSSKKEIKKIVHKGPSKWKVLYTDKTTGLLPKGEAQARYRENPNKITYF